MKLKLAAVFLLVCLLGLGVFYFLNGPSADVIYPSPNAYDMLQQAGEKMTPLPIDHDQTQDIQALKTYLTANADALALIDQAADHECRIRLSDMQTMEQMIEQSGYARAPLRLMMVGARLSQWEGRSGDAATQLAKIAVIGRRSAEGGLMVHQMIAIAIEREALEGLLQLTPMLDAAERDRIAGLIRAVPVLDGVANVSAIDSTIDAMVEREYDMTKREYGTLFGSYMIWQLGDSEVAQTPWIAIKKQMQEIEDQRQNLFDLLESSE